MLHVGDTVKVLCTTMYNDKPREYIKIGTICTVIETSGKRACIVERNSFNDMGFWYKEDELEKGHLEWVKG